MVHVLVHLLGLGVEFVHHCHYLFLLVRQVLLGEAQLALQQQVLVLELVLELLQDLLLPRLGVLGVWDTGTLAREVLQRLYSVRVIDSLLGICFIDIALLVDPFSHQH